MPLIAYIQARLELFMGGLEFERLALNMDQVQEYTPPPNPAKITDSRAVGYISIHGNESWELDALEPQVLADLIESAVEGIRDDAAWEEAEKQTREEKAQLEQVYRRWSDVQAFLQNGTEP